jgi:small-conductance mechanosensitive channel
VRRVDLQLTVIHGTPPERVIELLGGVATSHSDVLREPEAGAFFMGFSPNGMDFLLMFWAQQATHFRVRSEIAISVNAALREAGIEVAVPQQDVRVRSAEPSAAQRLTRLGAA